MAKKGTKEGASSRNVSKKKAKKVQDLTFGALSRIMRAYPYRLEE